MPLLNLGGGGRRFGPPLNTPMPAILYVYVFGGVINNIKPVDATAAAAVVGASGGGGGDPHVTPSRYCVVFSCPYVTSMVLR